MPRKRTVRSRQSSIQTLPGLHIGERIFSYTLFTVGTVLGFCVGGLISLSYLP
ncbi:MAG: hypothetical protein AAB448_02175 [Patescibacteria group bacterium]